MTKSFWDILYSFSSINSTTFKSQSQDFHKTQKVVENLFNFTQLRTKFTFECIYFLGIKGKINTYPSSAFRCLNSRSNFLLASQSKSSFHVKMSLTADSDLPAVPHL